MAAKKKAVAKVAAKAAKAPAVNADKPFTKSETYAYLAHATGLSRKQVASIFENLASLIGKSLGKKGPGLYVVPGLMKIKVVRKPATKEREGINPFTGEKTIFKAKPARNVVKVQALKGLKDMVK
ncbi:MAG TPA: HU family DNA-binding protein [Gammaproteobacteria bacterium]|jgi:nucleoid DNA-binding protein|nr:HU family DNA-binding protein [Gammaproteobacteria bacterium]